MGRNGCERWRRQSSPHAQYRSQGCPQDAHVYRALSKVGWKERVAAGKEKRGASPSRSSGVWQSQVPRHLKDRTQALVYTWPPATDSERLVAVSGPPSAPLFQTTCQIVAEHPPWLKNPKVPCCCYWSVAKSCLALCNPMNCSTLHSIQQASLSFTISWSLLKLNVH